MQPHVRHAKLLVCPVCGQYEDPLGDRGREIQRDRITASKGDGLQLDERTTDSKKRGNTSRSRVVGSSETSKDQAGR